MDITLIVIIAILGVIACIISFTVGECKGYERSLKDRNDLRSKHNKNLTNLKDLLNETDIKELNNILDKLILLLKEEKVTKNTSIDKLSGTVEYLRYLRIIQYKLDNYQSALDNLYKM